MYSVYLVESFYILCIITQCLFVKAFDDWKIKNSFVNKNDKTENSKYLHPEFFGILHRLEDYSSFAQKEELFATAVRNRLFLVKAEIKLMESYLEDVDDSSRKALENVYIHVPNSTSEERSIVIASSSVLAHKMLHRYSSSVEQLKNLIGSEYFKEANEVLRITLELPESNFDKFSTIFQNDLWIGYDDLFMSISALFKNQEIHGLKPDDFVYGTTPMLLSKSKPLVGLSLQQQLEIGIFALYRQKYYLAVDWLEKAKNSVNGNTVNYKDIHDITWLHYEDLIDLLLFVGIQEHNRQKSKMTDNKDDENLLLNLYVNVIEKYKPQHDRISMRDYIQNQNYVWHNNSSNLEPHIQFMKLCQGRFYQTPEHTSRLKCFYETKRHPYLFLCPVKAEQLSKSPPVIQYYDVLGAETIKNILNNNLGYMALMPPELEKLKPGVNTIEVDDRDRTSSGIGMKFKNLPKKIFTNAEIITGFNIWNSSDIATFAEYTYGRFYTYHGDVHEKGDKNREKTDVPKLKNNVGDDMDRMGTMLYYLKEPEMGGYTPFFQAGVAALPVKGSVVVWFNFYRNGTIRKDAYHGACPVVHGSKIMMHHWIRHISNWNRWKCSLSRQN